MKQKFTDSNLHQNKIWDFFPWSYPSMYEMRQQTCITTYSLTLVMPQDCFLRFFCTKYKRGWRHSESTQEPSWIHSFCPERWDYDGIWQSKGIIPKKTHATLRCSVLHKDNILRTQNGEASIWIKYRLDTIFRPRTLATLNRLFM